MGNKSRSPTSTRKRRALSVSQKRAKLTRVGLQQKDRDALKLYLKYHPEERNKVPVDVIEETAPPPKRSDLVEVEEPPAPPPPTKITKRANVIEWNAGQQRCRKLLQGPQRYTLIYGGARAGKTLLFVHAVISRALQVPGSRHLICRATASSVMKSIWLDTFPTVMRCRFPDVTWKSDKNLGFVRFPNGAEIWFLGLDKQEKVNKILGTEFCTIYFNECNEIVYTTIDLVLTRLAQVVFRSNGEMLVQRAYFDLNPVGTQHWTYQLFVKKLNPETKKEVFNPYDYVYGQLNPAENAETLSQATVLSYQHMPDRRRKRFWLGEFQDQIEGQLWPVDILDRCRDDITERPGHNYLKRVVVGVDPSGTQGDPSQRSDLVGIVVVGIGIDNLVYVLEDLTTGEGPEVWGKIVIDAYHRWFADVICIEDNFGGELVRAVVRVHDKVANIKRVHASKGKVVRAEPVSVLYTHDHEEGRGLVRHCGLMADLEDEMQNFSVAGYEGTKSPNRADAMIWGITELAVKPRPKWATDEPKPASQAIAIYQR